MTSEYVTLGHPDRTADYISEYILDRYVEKDPDTRYAVEVQIKDNWVSLAGEVTSKAEFTDAERAEFVRRAIAEVGYTPEYAAKWPAGCALDSSKVEVAQHISRQSQDIAAGVDAGGWGDQGIFWGMAAPDKDHDYMPLDHWYAKKIGDFLYEKRFGGLDIKTQVTVEDGLAKRCVVAVPVKPESAESALGAINCYVASELGGQCQTTVNGAGAYVKHSSFGDSGTTGRKLAVDFYGGNCRIGGGSPWTKDASKADLTLNAYARLLAKRHAIDSGQTAYVQISCCIGRKAIKIDTYGPGMRLVSAREGSFDRQAIVDACGLNGPVFAAICRKGLPYYIV